jgi:exopolysaccharide/PEP-CTERM locus tyrosine autokinase
MSIIEEAAKRLEQLRNAGVDVPSDAAVPVATNLPDVSPTPERFAQALEQAQSRESAALSQSRENEPAGAMPPPVLRTVKEDGHPAKSVSIDTALLSAAGFVTPEAQRTQIADEFRVIKRPIIKNARGADGIQSARSNLVMVTSAVPGEGKSFVALNLAMSIATEIDSTVLLVDADVANPSLMRMMRLPGGSKGLLDLLTNDSMTLADVLLRTNVDKLTILPAGTAHRRATEMLASRTMIDLLDEIASRYPDRIVVFDSPPLLATTEARVLATHMGQIVMVVEADRTTQLVVNRALDTIENCDNILMLLNKTARSEVGRYYGYGYGYGAYGAAS